MNSFVALVVPIEIMPLFVRPCGRRLGAFIGLWISKLAARHD
ncbi:MULTISPECIES: hypothetical protein [unclassified Bradyrhizobium]